MATRQAVRALVARGLRYEDIGRRLRIPAGRAYLIATGRPADGSDAYPPEERPPGLLPSAQHLVGPPAQNPTSSDVVQQWLRHRGLGLTRSSAS